MSRLFLLILVAALALGTTTALAEEDNYDPFLGKGEHTVWDVTTSDNVTIAGFGAKYGYYSEPDDEGWFTNVWVETNQSYLMFTCTYEDGEVFMGVRFILKSLTFSEEEVVLTEEIGEHEAQEATYHRWEDEDEHHIVSRTNGLVHEVTRLGDPDHQHRPVRVRAQYQGSVRRARGAEPGVVRRPRVVLGTQP